MQTVFTLIKRFNCWLALRLGAMLSSMAFFYLCVLLDLIELGPVIAAHDVIIWVTYLSQSVIQLIALPILGAQQQLQQDNHQRLEHHIKTIHAHLGIKENK
jgi:hypothetical protein